MPHGPEHLLVWIAKTTCTIPYTHDTEVYCPDLSNIPSLKGENRSSSSSLTPFCFGIGVLINWWGFVLGDGGCEFPISTVCCSEDFWGFEFSCELDCVVLLPLAWLLTCIAGKEILSHVLQNCHFCNFVLFCFVLFFSPTFNCSSPM